VALHVKEFLRPVAPKPLFQQLLMFRVDGRIRKGDLVRTKGTFNLHAIDHLRAHPALGRSRDDHGPARALGHSFFAGVVLDLLDLLHGFIEGSRHGLVHQLGFVALDNDRRLAITSQQLIHFLASNAREDGRFGKPVPVQVLDGQHNAVRCRVEEFVRMPCRGQRARLGFAGLCLSFSRMASITPSHRPSFGRLMGCCRW